MSGAALRPKSKLIATWAALIGGSLGLHRFYLHGWRDIWGWCSIPPTLLGLVGLQRARQIGLDDHLSWLLLPLLGLTLAAAMLAAIVYGLTPDDKWNARFNPAGPALRTGGLTILGVILALALGAAALMATVAFSAQRFFEYQAEPTQSTGR
jgi:TM2 domain